MAALTLEIILKSLVLITAILILTWFMRRSSAAIRHMYLSAAVVILLALPVVSIMLPSWDMGWFSNPFAPEEGKTTVTTEGRVETVKAADIDKAHFPSPSPGKKSRSHWFDWFWVVWIVGSVGLFFRLVGGKWLGYRVARKAPEINDDNFITTVEQIASRFGVTGKIPILESDHFN